MRPAMCRSSTVFPEPLPPMTTSVSALNASNDRPWRTSRLSKRFQTSLTSTIAVIALLSPEEDEKQLGEEERSEEHTSELQSQSNLVCRLLLETKNTAHSTLSYCSLRLLLRACRTPLRGH